MTETVLEARPKATDSALQRVRYLPIEAHIKAFSLFREAQERRGSSNFFVNLGITGINAYLMTKGMHSPVQPANQDRHRE